MKRALIRINAFIKGLILAMRPHIILGWLRRPLLKISNTLSLTRWITGQNKIAGLNDFYSSGRDYSKRYQLYRYVADTLQLENEAIDYLEFGVAKGFSFKWWLSACTNNDSRFYGFDTFEGLPENWGTFNRGDMAADIPETEDNRAKFIKGLFQDTLQDFLFSYKTAPGKRKIIHLDADLFSSTLFVLSSLAPCLKRGDILIFDEFNVPDHEFFAFRIFCDSWYIKTRLLGAVNNFLQTAFIIE
jgi:O-methyltransferase